MKSKKPVAVLTSDVHYSLPTLEVADKAMRLAIKKANELQVQLIIAGDLHETKANMRAECVNAMLETFSEILISATILRGNHDSINEKSIEHSLNFLARVPYNAGQESPIYIYDDKPLIARDICFFPYHHDLILLRSRLKEVPKGSIVIMHQGLQGTNSGEYYQDPTALNPEDVAGLRVISGHYHARQTIKLPEGGTWDFIGNPYSLNFGESADPTKGFQILYDDGSLEFVPTNLRRHIIFYVGILETGCWQIIGKHFLEDGVRKDDLVWVKITGAKEQLAGMTKEQVLKIMPELGLSNFKLTLHPLETTSQTPQKEAISTPKEVLDSIINNLQNVSEEQKIRLKELWRTM